jgi:hypothetical protein
VTSKRKLSAGLGAECRPNQDVGSKQKGPSVLHSQAQAEPVLANVAACQMQALDLTATKKTICLHIYSAFTVDTEHYMPSQRKKNKKNIIFGGWSCVPCFLQVSLCVCVSWSYPVDPV